jgi:hypothetical protein
VESSRERRRQVPEMQRRVPNIRVSSPSVSRKEFLEVGAWLSIRRRVSRKTVNLPTWTVNLLVGSCLTPVLFWRGSQPEQ